MQRINSWKAVSFIGIFFLVGSTVLSGCAFLHNYEKGNKALKRGNFDRALSYYNKHFEENPNLNYFPAYNNRALVWLKKYKFEKAIEDAEKAIDLSQRIDKHSWSHYAIKGSALTLLERYEEAVQIYKEGVEVIPSTNSIPGISDPYFMKNKLDKALKYFRLTEKEYKKKYANPYFYITLYYEMGNETKFRKTFNELKEKRYEVDKPPLKAGMKLYRAIIEYKQDDTEQAKKAAQRAISLDTKMPHFILDRAYHKYVDLSAENPYQAELYFYFAQAFESHNHQQLAYEMAYYASELDPSNPRFAEKLEELKRTVSEETIDLEHWPKIAADYTPL